MAGNARFHNKWHRKSHHTLPTVGYPDSATDPIGSPAEPFKGDFVLTGNLSAHGNAYIDGNTTVLGNLSVFGDLTYLETIVTVTSALSVINRGTGPALTVQQWGNNPIARFVDADAPTDEQKEALYIDNDGFVIIQGTEPAQKFDTASQLVQPVDLTVNGTIYSKKGVIWETPDVNCIYVSTTGSDLNSGLNESQKLKTIKKAAQIAFNRYGVNKCTIFIETGDYTEKNPIYIPAGTSIIGEGFLRRVSLRPYNKQLDFFWLNNACYLWGVTFRDTWEPCAATAFPNLLSSTPAYKVAFNTPGYEIDVNRPGGPFGLPIVSKPFITTSPYTQGCSSITRSQAVPIQVDLYPNYVLPGEQTINTFFTMGNLVSGEVLGGFDTVASIIEDGGITPPITGGGPVSPGAGDAAALLAINKPFIQTATVRYVNENYPTLIYNQALCYRDVGLIIDAIVYDFTNGTNLCAVQAGAFYFNGTTGAFYFNGTISKVPNQEKQTSAALRFAGILSQYVISNEIYPWYNQQFDYTKTAGGSESNNITIQFNTITSIIRNGVANLPPVVNWIPTGGASDAVDLITINKPFIQKQTVQFVDETFPGFAYNKIKCERDVGYILDAIIYGTTNGTTASAIWAGSQYYNGSVSLIKGQEVQTIAAINFANTLTQKVITNTLTLTSQSFVMTLSTGGGATKDINSSFDIINEIIITGDTSKTPTTHTPLPGANDAATLLQINKTFIQKEVIAYMEKAYPTFSFNKDKCERDVGYIVDAIVYDVTNGTNLSAITVGNYYYSGNTSLIPNQEVETCAAINYAKYLADQIAQNIPAMNLGAGCGIRVDGELASGFLRSFVTDSFTQFNEGGIGIDIINCGYAQLVSTFTICTDQGVFCESGGQCSISTSNCSFGLSGLVADGLSKFPVLTGYQYATTALAENSFYVTAVYPRPLSAFIAGLQANNPLTGIPVEEPYNGLLIKVQDDPASNVDPLLNPLGLQKYHGIRSVSALDIPWTYRITLEKNTTAPLTATSTEPKYVEFYLRSLIASSSHAFEYIGTGNQLELSVPALGGKTKNENEAVFSNNGIVYYSSTNERGDFKVGGGFKIVQGKGTVEGIDFNKSILALVTPLILSLE